MAWCQVKGFVQHEKMSTAGLSLEIEDLEDALAQLLFTVCAQSYGIARTSSQQAKNSLQHHSWMPLHTPFA